MTAAGVAAWICQRVGLSVVVGYLVAGALAGPFTPPFSLVAETERVQLLAQVGLVFLVFSIGLNLSINRLRRLGLSVALATFIGAILVLIACRAIGFMLGLSVIQSLFLAGTMVVSSSAIISKVLGELNLTHERPGQMALAITVLEDVVAIAMLTLLTSMIQFGSAESPPLLPVLGGLAAFVVVAAMLSLLVVPRLLRRLSVAASPETRTLVVTGLILGLAWLAVRMGYSLALGAFVLGAIIGSTRYKADIEDVFEGVQHIFGAMFFVAMGMLVDFRLLATVWPAMLGLTFLAFVLRPIATGFGILAVGNETRNAFQAALILTPLGEFSFIIAQLGVEAGVMPPGFFPMAVGASLLTCLGSPLLTKHSEALAARAAAIAPPIVRNWSSFYHDWLLRLRARQSGSVLWKLTGRRVLQVFAMMFIVSSLIVLAKPASSWATSVLGLEKIVPGQPTAIFWTLFGLVILAPLIAIWRIVSALALTIAEGATQGGPRERRSRPVLAFAIRMVALAVLALWLLALLPTGQIFLGAAATTVVVLAIVAIAFRRRLTRLQSRLEIDLMEQLRRASQATSASAWSAEIAPSDGWDLGIDEVTLPRDSALAGRTLGQLALRERFGCSVVGIDRQGHAILNPDARTILYPRDKLLLLGGTEQLARISKTLIVASANGTPSGFDELTMETLAVPEGSPLADKPLIELDLIRKAAVQVGGIDRGTTRVLAPAGQDRFSAGDRILVLGTPKQIEKFIQMLAPGPGASPVELPRPVHPAPAA